MSLVEPMRPKLDHQNCIPLTLTTRYGLVPDTTIGVGRSSYLDKPERLLVSPRLVQRHDGDCQGTSEW